MIGRTHYTQGVKIMQVNSIAILKTMEIFPSNLFLFIAEIPVILYKLRPQFISEEFKQFITTLNITHKRCHPYHI